MIEDLFRVEGFAETGSSGFGTSLAFRFYGELGFVVWSQTLDVEALLRLGQSAR